MFPSCVNCVAGLFCHKKLHVDNRMSWHQFVMWKDNQFHDPSSVNHTAVAHNFYLQVEEQLEHYRRELEKKDREILRLARYCTFLGYPHWSPTSQRVDAGVSKRV